ncbi:MAG: AAA family ATPase [Methanobrevibacter sp.]|nr:AAA family ATPase [Candidatus Methanovirga australis]
MGYIRDRLSLGLAEFNGLINENKIYVDKTRFIEKMLNQGAVYYFLSRPRRFGKTLFISTLKNFFEGNKELFKNTNIYDYNWDWDEYPVVRISMNDLSNDNPETLEKDILDLIKKIAKENNVKLNKNSSYIRKFSQLIEELAKLSDTKQIVVLIDEYDAPILDHIDNTNLANDNRKILQNFYNVLKNNEKHLKFVFITGITKFTKTSIFSKFNNFVELSLHEDYTTICGITHEEFKHYYHDQIEVMALKNKLTYNEVLDKFNHWYDGYSWDGINKVYNPFSTLNALYERKFMGFWFGSGTPTFLAETFKHKKIIEDYTKPRELKYTEIKKLFSMM